MPLYSLNTRLGIPNAFQTSMPKFRMSCLAILQGRSPGTHAVTHALEVGHHVFINLRTEKVYCLPDGYEVDDPSLDDIRSVLNPR